MWLEIAGAVGGAALGVLGGRLADRLPSRYGITHAASAETRRRRDVALVVLTAVVAAGIGHILASAPLSPGHAAFLLGVNAFVAAVVLAAAAIDIEHMILPNELTLGAAALCVLSSPLRAVGIGGSVGGAVLGFALAYVPFLLYKKLKGQSGMGLGDAKLAITAGAWHGLEGAIFVLFAGALQSVVAAGLMRVFGWTYAMPESVRAEIGALRARAAAGDAAAIDALADDPMAAADGGRSASTLAMRLPLGPFLALACLEALFLRRWLIENVFAWFLR